MLGVDRKVIALRASALAVALAAAPLLAFTALAPSASEAQTASHELIITISEIRALDRIDDFSNGDLYARVTINGDTMKSDVLKGAKDIKPNWRLSKKVTPGEHKVKLEIIDKDLTADDSIDINRIDNKRDLDFTVNTRTCRVEGFASTYRCGTKIRRAGNETKKADVTFTVTVKK